jgi:hypothetical protein
MVTGKSAHQGEVEIVLALPELDTSRYNLHIRRPPSRILLRNQKGAGL